MPETTTTEQPAPLVPPQFAAEWPACFTEHDIRLMLTVDMMLRSAAVETAEAAQAAALKYREFVFSALLASYDRLN